MVSEYLGTAGMVLIIIAWIPETIQNWKEKGKNLNLKFVALYLFGSLFLTYHAWVIQDFVFLTLNLLATLIAIFNAFIILGNKRKRGR
ncbi:MAG: hypothetical protein ABIH83_01630 [Candidatus Micrarchaeota archaeon]